MNLHKVIVRPGIRTSEKFGRLNFFDRDLFYGLLSAGNGKKEGWFENNPTVLRAALFAPCLGKVSERDVKAGLLRLREGRLIKLWTGRNGRAYGQIINYGQSFDYGEPLPADAHPPDESELALDVTDPPEPRPATARSEPNRNEVRGGETNFARRPPAPPSLEAAPIAQTPNPNHGEETQPEWIARLRVAWPAVDVTAELFKAERERRLKGKVVERQWFETNWLPNCSPAVELSGTVCSRNAVPEPEAWRAYLKEKYYGESWAESAGACEWKGLPVNWQVRIASEMTKRSA